MFFILVLASLCCMGVRADIDEQPVIITFQERQPTVTCTKMAIPGYPTYYIDTSSINMDVYQCPSYTIFNQNICSCILHYVAKPQPKTTIRPLPTTSATTTTTTTTIATTTTTPATTTTSSTTTTTASTTSTTTMSAKCLKSPYPGNPSKYKEEVPGHGMVVRRCPAGTIFSTQTCECEIDTRPKKKKGLCDGCKFDRGVGYNEHFTRCDKYVVCYPDPRNQSQLIGVIRQCDVGEYWNQDQMTCISSVEAYCENDPCSQNPSLIMYGYDGSCRGYWICRYGVSIGNCCPPGQAFKTDTGCVPDASCTSSCKDTRQNMTCDKIPVLGKRAQFQQMVVGHGYVTMRCAAGTVFNQTICECQTDYNPKQYTECTKEVEMNFTKGVTATVNNRVHVSVINVSYGNGSACFHGNSVLVMPRFSNAIIGKRLDIRVQFKLSYVTNSSKIESLQTLIYNGDCGPDASIAVTATPSKTVFQLRNKHDVSKSVEINADRQNYKWNNARFTLWNGIMAVTQHGYTNQTYFPGDVAKSVCGLKVGWGKDHEGFKGCMKELSISLC